MSAATALGGPRRPAPFAALAVGGVAAAVLVLLLALATRYGYHRDELYFLQAGRHPAWGYPDQPPLTPLVAHLMDTLAPGSLLALRLPSAIAAAAIVVMTGLTAREVGGGRVAQGLAALAVGTGVFFLAIGHLLSTTTFDALAWVAMLWLATRALRTGDERLWLAVGAAAGIGLLNKWQPAFLLGALVIGLAIGSGGRRHLRSPWLWAGCAIALALWLPNLVWQANHDWPQFTLSADVRNEYGTVGGRIGYVLFQLVLLSPLATVFWVMGLVALLRRRDLIAFRPLAWAFLVLFGVFLVSGGKGYYLGAMYPPLVAVGATVLERRLADRPGAVAALTAAVVLVAAIGAPIALPLLPPGTMSDSPYAGPGDDQLETVGWPRFAEAVATASATIPAGQRGRAVVFTENYGEAGAVARFGPSRGLPPVYSGHNGWAYWGPPPAGAEPVVVAGYDLVDARRRFIGCRSAARVDNGEGVDNEEQGGAILVCAAPRGGWRADWPRLTHLDA